MRQQKKDRRKKYRYLLAAVACLGILSIVYIQGKVSRTKSIDLTVNTEKKPALITLKEEKKSSQLQMAKSYEEIYQFVKASPYYGEEIVLESEEKVSAEVGEQDVSRAENTSSKTNTREENEIGIVDTEGGLKQLMATQELKEKLREVLCMTFRIKRIRKGWERIVKVEVMTAHVFIMDIFTCLASIIFTIWKKGKKNSIFHV